MLCEMDESFFLSFPMFFFGQQPSLNIVLHSLLVQAVVQSVWRESFFINQKIASRFIFILFSVVGHCVFCHQRKTEFIVFLGIFLLVIIALFHFFCRRRMNPFFLKFMYYAILLGVFIFLDGLRDSVRCVLVFSMVVGGGSAPGNFEPSLPVIDENEQFRGPESIIPNKIPGGEAGASSSQGSEILNGVPVQWSDTVTYTSPLFLASSVYVPADINDPLTVEKLSAFNQLLVNIRYDFFNGVHNPEYVRPLQLEVDQTPPKLLPERLEAMFWRERGKFYKNGEELPFYCVHSHRIFRG